MQKGRYSGHRSGRTVGRLLAAALALTLALPFTASALTLEEKEVNLYADPRDLHFILNHPVLSAKIARELEIAAYEVYPEDDKTVFRDGSFKVWLESHKDAEDGSAYLFTFAIGPVDLPPLSLTGSGGAAVKLTRKDDQITYLTLRADIENGDTLADKIAQKLPFILKTVMTMKLERFFQQLDKLGGYFGNDRQYLIDLANDEYSDLTKREASTLRAYLEKR